MLRVLFESKRDIARVEHFIVKKQVNTINAGCLALFVLKEKDRRRYAARHPFPERPGRSNHWRIMRWVISEQSKALDECPKI